MDARTGGLAEAQAAPVSDWPSPARAWYALFILTVGLMIATVDRGILTLLVAPIRSHLGITRHAIRRVAWLGVRERLCVARPAHRATGRSRQPAADHWHRHGVLERDDGAVRLREYLRQFFAARAGVGAGESAYAPAVYSILQDSFPPEKLPRIFAIMAIGFACGTSFGVILGASLLIAGYEPGGFDRIRIFGGLAPWQVVLILVAIPGVLLALVMVTVQEPRRRGLLPGAVSRVLPVRQVFDYFIANAANLRADVRRHGHQGHAELRQRRVAAGDVSPHAPVADRRKRRCGSASSA